jgi:hypothetical protein
MGFGKADEELRSLIAAFFLTVASGTPSFGIVGWTVAFLEWFPRFWQFGDHFAISTFRRRITALSR